MSLIRYLSFSFLSLFLLTGCMRSDSSMGEKRSVNNVHWYKKKSIDALDLSQKDIPDNSVGVFFYRLLDNDVVQTSANLAINDRFQSSLQAGHFSHVYSCSGLNELSADITANKNNDLLRGVVAYPMHAKNNYYFSVDVSNTGKATISPVSQKIALEAMKGMSHQTHQISRVIPRCPNFPARTELKVFFETDKSFIQKKYYSEIKRVAHYMKKYPNVIVSIEGHTDNRASKSHNMMLSDRRARAVKTVLINHFEIDAMRIKATAYGESRPVASNNTVEGMQKNRRVIAVFSYR